MFPYFKVFLAATYTIYNIWFDIYWSTEFALTKAMSPQESGVNEAFLRDNAGRHENLIQLQWWDKRIVKRHMNDPSVHKTPFPSLPKSSKYLLNV